MTGEPAISLPTAKGHEELLLQMAKLFEDQRQFKMLNPVPKID